MASLDTAIYVYTFPELRSRCKPLRKHGAGVTHIDLTTDSKYMLSNSLDYELLYWEIDAGKLYVKGADKLRNERW